MNKVEAEDRNAAVAPPAQARESTSNIARKENQRKRQRNKEKYRNRDAKSGGSKYNGAGAGVADFQESGSNYGRVVKGGESNPSFLTKTHRPWRKSNVNGQL